MGSREGVVSKKANISVNRLQLVFFSFSIISSGGFVGCLRRVWERGEVVIEEEYWNNILE